MSSTRCPGKVLREAGGKPLLGWLLDGLLQDGLQVGSEHEMVVATSADESDDPIAEYCTERGTEFFRGPLEDVTLRLLKASRGHSHFIRLCADSPLISAGDVDRAIGHSRDDASDADLVTNVPNPGNSVEVVSRKALEAAYPHMSAEEKEHVTLYMYRHPAMFDIVKFESQPGILVDTEAQWLEFKQAQEK